MKNECPFCSDKIKKRIIDEKKYSYVLLSNPRLAMGHVLIIPKRHIQKFSDLKSSESSEIFKQVGIYQDRILKKLSTGTEIRQNYKPYFEDSRTHVNHFHIHIIPREETDELAKKVDIHRKPFYKDLTKEEEKKMRKWLFLNLTS